MSNTFKIKDVVAEDFVNYKLPSMFIITSICNWKCCHEGNFSESVCQNNSLVNKPTKEVSNKSLIDLYRSNPLTKAVVIGGLDPLMQFEEVLNFIDDFRNVSEDNIVIYTGYNKDEVLWAVNSFRVYPNIVIKFGRYIPNHSSHFDSVLGVNLISDNQYAERIS